MGECRTPGCIYSIKIEPYARWGNFYRAHVNIRVGLPERVDMAAPSQYEGGCGDSAPWGIKQKAYLDAVEEIAHRHMEAAIAEIGAFDLTQGGTFAKAWPDALQAQGETDADRWTTITADAAYYVDNGVNLILCDRMPKPVTLLLKNAVVHDEGEKTPSTTEENQ